VVSRLAIPPRAIQHEAREYGVVDRPRWPAVVLRTPKGWTGPKEVDGKPAEGTFRSHQVPMADIRDNAEHLAQLEAWMLSYEPKALFDDTAGSSRSSPHCRPRAIAG